MWRLEDEEAKQRWTMEEEARLRAQRAQAMAADQTEVGASEANLRARASGPSPPRAPTLTPPPSSHPLSDGISVREI